MSFGHVMIASICATINVADVEKKLKVIHLK